MLQDLRFVIGVFFGILSTLLFLAAFIGYGGAGPQNPNLICAMGMAVFSLGIVAMSWKASRDAV